MEVECIMMDTFSISYTHPSRYLESKYNVNVLSLEKNQRQQQMQRILFHVKTSHTGERAATLCACYLRAVKLSSFHALRPSFIIHTSSRM
jgi:hypothetical protein